MQSKYTREQVAAWCDALDEPSGVYLIFGFIPDEMIATLKSMFGKKIFVVAPNKKYDGLRSVYVSDEETIALAKFVVSELEDFNEDYISALTVGQEHQSRRSYGGKWPWERRR